VWLPPAVASPFAALAGPSSVAFSPSSGLLSVADSDANEVNAYSVSPVGGLTGVGGPAHQRRKPGNGGRMTVGDQPE
jgi:hypothetical protein